MLVLGLTGGIACGKSTISLTLRELGAVIVDGDVLSRELTATNGPALPDIRRAFGDGVFHPDGTLNRRELGAVVFADDKARETLDAIMQPLLLTMILRPLRMQGYPAHPSVCWTCPCCTKRASIVCATGYGAPTFPATPSWRG